MSNRQRAFVVHHTTLRPVPDLEEVRLHLAAEVLPLWRALQLETRDPDVPLPYWAFAWIGGLALGRHLRESPALVQGRSVLDVGSGSGLVAISAALAGAAEVTANDIDPYAHAAIRLNALANRVTVSVAERDLLAAPPPPVDVILAGDCWYEAGLAARVQPWLEQAATAGTKVLVGDAGRRYLPLDRLVEVASYEVRTTTELEDLALKRGHVLELDARHPGVGAADGPRSGTPAEAQGGAGPAIRMSGSWLPSARRRR